MEKKFIVDFILFSIVMLGIVPEQDEKNLSRKAYILC